MFTLLISAFLPKLRLICVNAIIEQDICYEGLDDDTQIWKIERDLDCPREHLSPNISFTVCYKKTAYVPLSQFLYSDDFKPIQYFKTHTVRGDDGETDYTTFVIEKENPEDLAATVILTLKDLYGSSHELSVINIKDLHLVSPFFIHHELQIKYHFVLKANGNGCLSDLDLMCNIYRRILRKLSRNDKPRELDMTKLDPTDLEIRYGPLIL